MRLLRNIWDQVCAWTVRHPPNPPGPGIGRMVVVAGACASGKSALCGEIVRNRYQSILGADMSGSVTFHAKQFRKRPVHEVCPGGEMAPMLFHYDISWLGSRGLENYAEDPATGVMRIAGELDIILVVPTPERLMRQLRDSEAVAGHFKKPHHGLYMGQYGQPGWLSRLYGNWIHFCAAHVPRSNYLVYAERAGVYELVRCDSHDAAMDAVKAIYREQAGSRPVLGNGLPAVAVAWLIQWAEALV